MNRFKEILILFTLFFATFTVYAQRKHALLISVASYPEEGGWSKLSSDRDLLYMRSILSKQGFPQHSVIALTEEQVTLAGISHAMEKLEEQVNAGDVVLIHCSSHGEQVEDDNQDEADGLDETIVTYTAVAPSRSKNFAKDQAGYFRDDLLGRHLNRLRKKLGREGDVIVILDACHSGSGTRGMKQKVRGGQPPFVSSSFDYGLLKQKDTLSAFGDLPSDDPAAGLARYVIFSATRPDESNFEIRDDEDLAVGPLTYAFVKALETAAPFTSYRALFSGIQSVMYSRSPLQHPVAEGNGLDRQLFGGNFVAQFPYFEIDAIAGDHINIKAGRFSGLDRGVQVTVHKHGTVDPALSKPLARGTVEYAGPFRSSVRLSGMNASSLQLHSWVFPEKAIFRQRRITVQVGQQGSFPLNSIELSALKSVISELPMFSLHEQGEVSVVKESEDTMHISSNGHLFGSVPMNNGYEQLKLLLEQYAAYRFLKEAELTDPGYHVELKLVPLKDGLPDTAQEPRDRHFGSYVFYEGDEFAVLFTNHMSRPVFLNILDLQPDGKINPVLPHRNNQVYPGDLKIAARSSRLFKPFIIGPPYGMEVLKVFVSTRQIDMEQAILHPGQVQRAAEDAMETFFGNAFAKSLRGHLESPVIRPDGIAFNILFEIRRK